MVTLSGLNSIDPDDGIASYFWEQTDGPAVDLSNASSAEASFLDTDVGTDDQSLTFKLTVTDNGDLQSSDFCVVNISWINEPPMADAGPDLTGSWVSLNPFQSGPKSWIQGILNVENWGTQMAQSSLIYFYLSTDEILDKTDIKIAKTTLDILEAGQSIDISFKAKLPDREFNNYIIAQIDSLKAVLETDETNNIIVSWPL